MTCTRSPLGTLYGRAVADDTLGELVMRWLSRKRSGRCGVSPYIACMSVVKLSENPRNRGRGASLAPGVGVARVE